MLALRAGRDVDLAKQRVGDPCDQKMAVDLAFRYACVLARRWTEVGAGPDRHVDIRKTRFLYGRNDGEVRVALVERRQ